MLASHREITITMKSPWNNPDHPQITLKSLWNHPEITVKSPWNHNEIYMAPSPCTFAPTRNTPNIPGPDSVFRGGRAPGLPPVVIPQCLVWFGNASDDSLWSYAYASMHWCSFMVIWLDAYGILWGYYGKLLDVYWIFKGLW